MSLQTAPLVAQRGPAAGHSGFQPLTEESAWLAGLERFPRSRTEESKEGVPFEFKNQSLPAVCDSLYHFSPDDEKDILEAEEDLPQVILGFPSLKRKRLACPIGTLFQDLAHKESKEDAPSKFKNQSLPAACDSCTIFLPDDEKDILEAEEELNTAFMSEAKTPSDMSLQTAPLVAATSEDLPQVILGFSPSLKRKRLACPDWNISHTRKAKRTFFEFKNQSLPAVCDSLYHFSPDDEKDILEAEEELNTAFMSEAKTPSDMSLQTAPLLAETSEDLPVILGFSPSLKRKRLACPIGTLFQDLTQGKQRGRSSKFKNQSLPAVCDSLYHFSPDDEKDILEAEEELNTAFMSEAKTPSDMSLQTAPLVAATSEDLPQVILGFSPSLKRKRLACPDWNAFPRSRITRGKQRGRSSKFKNQSLPAAYRFLWWHKRGPAQVILGFTLTEEETLGLPGLERFPRSRTRGKQRGRSLRVQESKPPCRFVTLCTIFLRMMKRHFGSGGGVEHSIYE
ncbi:hypothetical protein E2320_022571 [Naja naja]|nr:hypothetical protein E2320_022571 [Naja naja]